MTLHKKLEAHLEQGVVGFPTALASSVGVIMASPVILTATSGFGMAGGTFALAMVVALIMMLAQSTTFAEAASILPTSGSTYDYIACGLGRFWAIVGTISAYLIVHLFAGTSETILSGIMALVNFEHMNSVMEAHGGSWMVGVGLVVLFGILNALGIHVFGKVEVVLTFGMWATLTIFGIAGILEAPHVKLDSVFGTPLSFEDPQAVLSLVGLAMFMFVGSELVTPLAPELKKSARTLPRAMLIGLLGVGTCMFMYGMAVLRQVENTPMDPNNPNGAHLLDTPMAIPAFAEQVMGPFGRIWLGLGLLFAGGACINTLVAAVPRIIYGMALDGALPKFFAYLHPRFKTPWIGILVAVLMPTSYAIYLDGNLDKIFVLVLAAVCAWGLAYILVTLSVISLRIRRPDFPRAYKSPFFPIPQIISTVGILLAIWYIAPPGLTRADVFVPFGIILAITGTYALIWTTLVQRQNPFKPVAIETVLEEEFADIKE
ncbi:APC family permease [Leeia sp. TBRC 13508]|uniref:APC family permease n=1 Tax=Leeia speluncae TaxID=2884804 RepID=A0ABS8D9R9_9NEIS|nr:APC family permease [Leeia speluncae]MCB6184958.1 APC family permease [Leeia speluncae]